MAEVLGVTPDRVLLTNGGAEAIALVANELTHGWVEEPEFALYQRHLQADPAAGRWLSDPNNPTGRLAAADTVATVRDEAFYPLATGQWTRGDADAIVVGSLTKVFACPGVRMGYVLANDPDLIVRLGRAQPRWSLSGLAGESIPDLLATAQLVRWRDEIAALRSEMVLVLTDRGWIPEPAAANYLWIPDAPGLRDALFTKSILVRSAESFGVPDGVRIAVPRPQDLAAFTAAVPHRA
jgi:threonine-phosphate decarboxylase